MGTKTIGLRDDAYERLKARKRDDESFTDLVNRLLDESTPNWREGFGTLPESDGDELENIVTASREGLSGGLSKRQGAVLEELVEDDGNGNETA